MTTDRRGAETPNKRQMMPSRIHFAFSPSVWQKGRLRPGFIPIPPQGGITRSLRDSVRHTCIGVAMAVYRFVSTAMMVIVVNCYCIELPAKTHREAKELVGVAIAEELCDSVRQAMRHRLSSTQSDRQRNETTSQWYDYLSVGQWVCLFVRESLTANHRL